MFSAYVFEAKSIQSYVLDGGKLADMVGASNLLDVACDPPVGSPRCALLDDVLKALPDLQDRDFTRRAGGAFIVVHENAALIERFRATWQIVFQNHLPGMTFTDAIAVGRDATAAVAAAAEAALPTRNVVSPPLPIGHPLMQIAPRSGTPAVGWSKREAEFVDEATRRKRVRRLAGNAQRDFIGEKYESDGLRQLGRIVWPVNMKRSEAQSAEEPSLPLPEENSYVGVVHADGNGMGQTLLRLRETLGSRPDATAVMRQFSTAVVHAMQQAVQRATVEVLAPQAVKCGDVHVMPARPLVLAGDDVTVIVRGDLAVEFAAVLVRQFRRTTNEQFGRLWHTCGLDNMPPELSAGAGIAFVKATQPFGPAYGLAAQLTKFAKDHAKKHTEDRAMPEGTIAFHRITSTFMEDYESILRNELTFHIDDAPHILTCNPYSVEANAKLPQYESLKKLRALIADDALSRGPLRHLSDLFLHDAVGAKAIYERWLQVVDDTETGKEARLKFDRVLSELSVTGAGAGGPAGNPLQALFTADGSTPLVDAMQWHMAARDVIR